MYMMTLIILMLTLIIPVMTLIKSMSSLHKCNNFPFFSEHYFFREKKAVMASVMHLRSQKNICGSPAVHQPILNHRPNLQVHQAK
jgi:hypothetical protein